MLCLLIDVNLVGGGGQYWATKNSTDFTAIHKISYYTQVLNSAFNGFA